MNFRSNSKEMRGEVFASFSNSEKEDNFDLCGCGIGGRRGWMSLIDDWRWVRISGELCLRRVMNSDGIGLPLFRAVLLWIVCCNVFLRVFFLKEVTNSGRFGLFSSLEIVRCYTFREIFFFNFLLSNSS